MNYKVPLKDIKFVTERVLDMPTHYTKFTKGQNTDPETLEAIYEEAAKFCENELQPLNKVGDEVGCKFENGEVTTPPGFKEAYNSFVENGWPALTGPVEYDGQGMPESVGLIMMEMMIACNHSWSMYPGLSSGAIKTIYTHAPQEMKDRFMPPMVAGKWTGTMCLTEPHCGSDLGLLKTFAEETGEEEGVYNITGSKIFISSGEHDLADNIVHIVLARLPGAPEGIKGISLFIVPKFNVNDDGSVGDRNAVNCGSIEEKMGIHGNSTCVINFDGAKGYLISEPHKGMRAMFTFINESRLGVAMHGQAHSEVSFQKALAYAKDRLQFRTKPRKDESKAADPIIGHPDVRRMLLTQKAFAEGGRMLNMYCGKLVDIEQSSDFSDSEREHADTMLAVLTPIAKGFLSETSLEATNYGIQVLGGHGFVKEWGMEQEVRDARISQLYEGTTGIQGLDLLGRKILGTRGKVLKPLVKEVESFIKENRRNKFAKQLKPYMSTWESLTRSIGMSAMRNTDEVNAAAVDYLMMAGYTTVAFFWAKAAVEAEKAIAEGAPEPEFYKAKIATADFYFQRIMPRVLGHEAAIKNGMDSLMALEEENFVFA
ncbi:MAG: acyl-CoA dehydrogenase C-terminal domain-containing protein [Gammaproteobacteria bacterium]|nr:acyl-CoA dehydrogenase C-terminal domain-containing protein [Gammaproteobacteria bacterium]